MGAVMLALYFDTQEDAIQAGRKLSNKLNVDLVIHRPDGTRRDG